MGTAVITLPDSLAFALQSFRLVSSEQALKELGLSEHQLRFTCRVHLQDTRKEQETALRVYSHLKRCALALTHPYRQGEAGSHYVSPQHPKGPLCTAPPRRLCDCGVHSYPGCCPLGGSWYQGAAGLLDLPGKEDGHHEYTETSLPWCCAVGSG